MAESCTCFQRSGRPMSGHLRDTQNAERRTYLPNPESTPNSVGWLHIPSRPKPSGCIDNSLSNVTNEADCHLYEGCAVPNLPGRPVMVRCCKVKQFFICISGEHHEFGTEETKSGKYTLKSILRPNSIAGRRLRWKSAWMSLDVLVDAQRNFG